VALTFHPGPGAIVICNFTTGFLPPEMVKIRPVVIVSPRRRTTQLATVVPLSSTPPSPPQPWHHQCAATAYPPARGPIWAKCDMLATVGLARLDRVRVRGTGGGWQYQVFQVPASDLAAILVGVKAALGLP